MTIHQDCKGQSGVSDDVITNALLGNFNYNPQLAEHLFCMSQKLGLQDANGRINRDVLRQRLSGFLSDPAEIDNLVTRCGVEQETPQQTAFKSAQCFYGSVRSTFLG